MSQFTAIICQGCHKGIRAHHGKEAGVFELSPGPNGLPIKRGWHTKKCWPLERRRRRKEQRQEAAWIQKKELADLEAETAFRISKELDSKVMKENEVSVPPPVVPEPPPVEKPGGFKGARGVGLAVYKIMDAIPPGQEWTQHEIAAQLQRAGFTTTYETVQQLSYIYRKQRRGARKTRQDGPTRVFMFDEPTPAEPPVITTQNNQTRKALEQRRVEVKEQIKKVDDEIKKLDEPEITGKMVVHSPRPLPKPAPTPGLSRADVNRAFNDFQAFMLEALMDFRNELLKMSK